MANFMVISKEILTMTSQSMEILEIMEIMENLAQVSRPMNFHFHCSLHLSINFQQLRPPYKATLYLASLHTPRVLILGSTAI